MAMVDSRTGLQIRAAAATAILDLAAFGFNPGQKRGPDGRFIKMGGAGSAGKSRPSEGGGAGAGGSAPTVQPPQMVEAPPATVEPVAPRTDKRPRTEMYKGRKLRVARHPTRYGLLQTSINGTPVYTPIGTRPEDMDRELVQLRRDIDAADRRRAEGEPDAFPAAWYEGAPAISAPAVGRAPRPSKIKAKPRSEAEAGPLSRKAALEAGIASGVASSEKLSGGMMGDVQRVQFNNGATAVHKTPKGVSSAARGGWHYHRPPDQNAAEELASLVGGVLGVSTPAVNRQSEDSSYMELMPGRTATEIYGANIRPGEGLRIPNEINDSPQGQLIGLLDVVTDNGDRNTGNWLVDDNGDMHAIDQAMAFASRHNSIETSVVRSPFASSFLTKDGKHKSKNPLTPADVDRMREGLEGLRPTFVERGREQWLDEALARVDKLAGGAKGTVDLIRPREPGGVSAERPSADAPARATGPTNAELVEIGNAKNARKLEAAERRRKPTAEDLGVGERNAPEIGPDGKYLKPVKQYATWNGKTVTRTSKTPYKYAAVVEFPWGDHEPGVVSWHRTRAAAEKGTLTGMQRQNGARVVGVAEVGLEPPVPAA